MGIELDQPLSQLGHRPLGLGLGPVPVAAAQAGELAVCPVLAAADVFIHQVQLGNGDVEHIGTRVGDLHVLLVHLVHPHLRQLHKAAYAVLAVDHQVPGAQVGVRAELLAVGLVLDVAAFLPYRRGGALREDRAFQVRVFHPCCQPPHADHRLTGTRQVMEGKVHRRTHLLLPQEALEVQRPLFAGHQHGNGVARALVVRKVADSGLQAAAKGGQLLGHNGQQGLGTAGIAGHGKGVQIHHRPVLQPAGQLLHPPGVGSRLGAQPFLFDQGLDVLVQLPEVVLPPLGNAPALAEQHDGVGGEIVRRCRHLGIDLRQMEVAAQSVRVARQTGQHLPRRKDHRLLQPFGPPLGHGVKKSHGVDIGIPILHPDRAVISGGKDV